MTNERPNPDGEYDGDDQRIGTAAVDEEAISALRAILVRASAVFYDLLLLISVWFVVTAVALYFNDGEAIVHPLYRVAMVGVGWLFFDRFWRRGGQTLGMRAWRLKLIDDGGGPLTRARTALRYVLGLALFGVTYASIPFDPRRRALHDRLTRTRVIRVIRE